MITITPERNRFFLSLLAEEFGSFLAESQRLADAALDDIDVVQEIDRIR